MNDTRGDIAELGAPFSTIRMALTASFIVAMIVGAVLSPKVVLVAGYPLPGGVFIFPLTYVIVTIMAECYGIVVAWRLIWIGVASLTLAWLAFTAIELSPSAPCCVAASSQFAHMYKVGGPVILVVDVAFLVGQACSLWAFKLLTIYTNGRLLWMRFCGCPMIAQIVVVLIAVPLTITEFHGDELVLFLLGRILLAVVYSCVMLPFIYAAVVFIRTSERPRSFRSPEDFNGR